MYNYEKGLIGGLVTLAVLLVWQLIKTIFYRLPCAVCRLVTHNK